MDISEAIKRVKTFDEAVSVGIDLVTYGSDANWYLGDLVNRIRIVGATDPELRRKVGTMRSFATAVRQSYSTVRDAARVARVIPREMREKFQGLTFGHFREIVKRGMTVEDINKWSEQCEDNGWGVMRLRAELRNSLGKPQRDPTRNIRGLISKVQGVTDDDINDVLASYPEDVVVALDAVQALSRRLRFILDSKQATNENGAVA